MFGCGRITYQGRPGDGEVSKHLEFLGLNGMDLVERAVRGAKGF